MWDTFFPFEERLPAKLYGYHRAYCIYSWHYRGTEQRPGLVLGLDRGGSCRGIVFRLHRDNGREILPRIDERELVTSVYHARNLNLYLDSGHKVMARCYIADPTHRQYAGRLTLHEQQQLITNGQGVGGHNLDYFKSTQQHLFQEGIEDRGLKKLADHFQKRPN